MSRRIADHALERVALASMLLGLDDACDAALETLEPSDFDEPKHVTLCNAIFAVLKRGDKVDVALVRSELESAGRLSGDLDQVILDVTNDIPISDADAVMVKIRNLATARRLVETSLRIAAESGDGIEDIDDFLQRSQQSVLQVLEKRSDAIDVVSIGQAANAAVARLVEISENQKCLLGLSTGIAELDRLTTGIGTGELWIYAGRPGMGKSALAQLAASVQRTTNVVIFSLEMPPVTWAQRMLATDIPIELTKLRTGWRFSRDEWKRIESSVLRIGERKIFIPDTMSITVGGISRLVRRIAAKHGPVGLVVVDYLQLVRPEGRYGNREQEVAHISRQLKILAGERNAGVLALCQLNRDCEKRPDKRPQMSDLRESGAIENDADAVIGIYRDAVYNPDTEYPAVAELLVLKQRMGAVGTVKCSFTQEYTRFANLEPMESENDELY